MEYLRSARALQKKGRQKEAYSVLIQARLHYPDDPVLLSFYGCLQAMVDKKFRSGVESCRKALASFKPKDAESATVLYPLFYLNLGRAYHAADKKREAVSAYQQGLSYDRKNSEIKNELTQMGVRKKSPLPFLDRSNPINVIVGKLIHRNP
jgi:tetratricopeptide (TPR) repeat protein